MPIGLLYVNFFGGTHEGKKGQGRKENGYREGRIGEGEYDGARADGRNGVSKEIPEQKGKFGRPFGLPLTMFQGGPRGASEQSYRR